MPLILVTNDDGIYSPGLHAAAEAVAHLGDLLIVAPRTQQTAMSRALPRGQDIGRIDEVPLSIGGNTITGYAVYGSPALAVVHALYELASEQPALCVSGINYGENVGMTLALSGTVGAAMEASLSGVPSLAVSRGADRALHHAETYGELDWSAAGYFTRLFAERMLHKGLPPEIAVLNLNVPADATPSTEMRATVQSKQAHYYFTRVAPRDRTQGHRPEVVLTVKRDTLEPDSDVQGFLFDNVVTVTPLTNDLTARTDVQTWFSTFGF